MGASSRPVRDVAPSPHSTGLRAAAEVCPNMSALPLPFVDTYTVDGSHKVPQAIFRMPASTDTGGAGIAQPTMYQPMRVQDAPFDQRCRPAGEDAGRCAPLDVGRLPAAV